MLTFSALSEGSKRAAQKKLNKGRPLSAYWSSYHMRILKAIAESFGEIIRHGLDDIRDEDIVQRVKKLVPVPGGIFGWILARMLSALITYLVQWVMGRIRDRANSMDGVQMLSFASDFATVAQSVQITKIPRARLRDARGY